MLLSDICWVMVLIILSHFDYCSTTVEDWAFWWILEVMNLVNKVINTGAVYCFFHLIRCCNLLVLPSLYRSTQLLSILHLEHPFPQVGFSPWLILSSVQEGVCRHQHSEWLLRPWMSIPSKKDLGGSRKAIVHLSDSWRQGVGQDGWKKQTAGAWPASAFCLLVPLGTLPNCFCPVIRPFD